MLEELKKQTDAIGGLKDQTVASRGFVRWRKRTEEILKSLYGDESAEVREFTSIYYTPLFLTCRMGDEAFDEAYRNGLEEARTLLSAMVEKVKRRS